MDKLEVIRESVDTKTAQGTCHPDLRHMIILEVEGVDTLVVTDCKNKCLKSFYTKDNNMSYSRLQLNNNPFDIAKLEDNKVIVNVPETCQIVTIGVTPELYHVAHINTSKKYYSVAMMPNSRLAAGGCNYLDVINLKGEVLQSFTHTWPFRHYAYMCVDNIGRLLVSDWGEGTVTCSTSDGKVVWTYLCGSGKGRLTQPRGITTTGGGDILVVDSKLKKVLQLSSQGKFVRVVLTSKDDLCHPGAVCVDKCGTMYISDSGQLNILMKFVIKAK